MDVKIKFDVTILHDVVKIINIYMESLEKTGFSGKSPDLYEYIINTCAAVDAMVDSDFQIDTGTAKKLFNKYFKIQSNMDAIDVVKDILELNRFDESQIGTSSSSGVLSGKHIQDMADLLDTVSIQVANIQTKIQSMALDSILANAIELNVEFVSSPNSNTSLLKWIDEISAIYKGYVEQNDGIYVVELYFILLARIYTETVDKPGSKPIVKHINDTIAALKYDLLNTEQYQIEIQNLNLSNCEVNAMQKLVQTFRLIPGVYQSMEDLLKSIGVVENKVSKDLKQRLTAASSVLSSTVKYGFIVIFKQIKKPILQTVDSIINDSFITLHNLHQPSNMGVNAVAIERSRTIEPLEIGSLKNRGILRIGKSVNFYYIIQTLDGVNFSIVSPWGVDSTIKYVPADKFTLEPSKKLEMYNSILSDAILKNLHKPFIDTTTQSEVKREDAYWNSVRVKVKKFILTNYRDDLAKYKIIRLATVKGMMTDDKTLSKQINFITQLAMEDLTTATGKLVQKSSIVEIFKSELAMLWLNESDSIKRRYKSTLEELFDENRTAVERSVSAAHKMAVVNHIIEAVSKIIDEHLKIFINRKSGIFVSIMNIVDVLEKTLLQ